MKNLQTYNGNDLGAVYSKQSTSFRLWAPTADKVRVCFYATGDGSEAVETTIQTAGKIYHAPLDEIDDMRLLTSFDIEGWQIDGYWIWATKRYLYTEGDHFTKDSAETGFWRYDIATDVWEEIREEDV